MNGNGQTAKPERPVPDVMLERYLADDLNGEQRARIEAQCEASAVVRVRLEQLREERAAFYAANPPPMFAHRVAVRLAYGSDSAETASAKRPSWTWWAVLAGPSAAAAAALLVAVTYGDLSEEGPALPSAAQAPAVPVAISESETVGRKQSAEDVAPDAPTDAQTDAGVAGQVGKDLDAELDDKLAIADQPGSAAADTGYRDERRKPKGSSARVRPDLPRRVAKPTSLAKIAKVPRSKPKPKLKAAAPPPTESAAKKRGRGGEEGKRSDRQEMRRSRTRADERDRFADDSAGSAGGAASRDQISYPPHPPPKAPPPPPSEPEPEAARAVASAEDTDVADDGEAVESDAQLFEPSGAPVSYDVAPAARAEHVGATRAGASREVERKATKKAKKEKAGPAFTAKLEVKRGSHWRRVTSGTVLRPGDVVRVSVAARTAGYVVVVGLRSDGSRTMYHSASNAAVRIAAGSRINGRRIEIRSKTPVRIERVYILFAEAPFTVSRLLRGVGGMPGRLPFAGKQITLDLRIEIDVPAASSTAAEPR